MLPKVMLTMLQGWITNLMHLYLPSLVRRGKREISVRPITYAFIVLSLLIQVI
jgi:hypothetical protein